MIAVGLCLQGSALLNRLNAQTSNYFWMPDLHRWSLEETLSWQLFIWTLENFVFPWIENRKCALTLRYDREKWLTELFEVSYSLSELLYMWHGIPPPNQQNSNTSTTLALCMCILNPSYSFSWSFNTSQNWKLFTILSKFNTSFAYETPDSIHVLSYQNCFVFSRKEQYTQPQCSYCLESINYTLVRYILKHQNYFYTEGSESLRPLVRILSFCICFKGYTVFLFVLVVVHIVFHLLHVIILA